MRRPTHSTLLAPVLFDLKIFAEYTAEGWWSANMVHGDFPPATEEAATTTGTRKACTCTARLRGDGAAPYARRGPLRAGRPPG